MTTIAYRSGVVAADTRASYGSGLSPETCHKITLGKTHPVIYAIVGDVKTAQAAVRELEITKVAPWDGGDTEDLDIDAGTDVYVFHADGRIIGFEDSHVWREIDAEFLAFGSGRPAALGALHMGADPVEAVRIAALVDPATGGRIQSLCVSDIKKPTSKKLRVVKS